MKLDKTLILALIIFSLLTIPFIGSVPYLDGNIDFVKSYNFFSAGLNGLLNGSGSIHPPAKEILAAVFFQIGGLNVFSYGLIGPLIGILGVATFYSLSTTINKEVAIIATLLLATSPLFLANSIFTLTDYLLTVLIIAGFYFYIKEKYFFYFICASLALLTKETGMVLIVSIAIVEIFFSLKKFLISITPSITAFAWFLFLKLSGREVWSDWNFSESAAKGTIYTVINNIYTLDIFNKYAYQNWLQHFVLNFNWLYWLIILVGIISFLKYKNRGKILKNKILLIVATFYLIYLICVLSFQTYTIPRYALPLEPFFLIAVAFGIYEITNKSRLLKPVVYTLLAGIVIVRLFTSVDPISTYIWGRNKILGQNFYALNSGNSLSGFDGITYNLQYNLAVKRRSDIIFGKYPDKNNCAWIFPDPTTDIKTINILDLKTENLGLHCFPLN